jgi:hypothetical protein
MERLGFPLYEDRVHGVTLYSNGDQDFFVAAQKEHGGVARLRLVSASVR